MHAGWQIDMHTLLPAVTDKSLVWHGQPLDIRTGTTLNKIGYLLGPSLGERMPTGEQHEGNHAQCKHVRARVVMAQIHLGRLVGCELIREKPLSIHTMYPCVPS